MSQNQDLLAREIDALSKGEIKSWPRIGAILDRVDQTGYWRCEASSFTEWLQRYADRLNLKESTFWRYLSAARYYISLQRIITERGISCPSLTELSDKVSPENLELLSKLDRVAPVAVLQRLAPQVIEGSITRAELRTVWQAYRPALGGRTARGLGVSPPQINPSDHEQYQSLTEAMVLAALASGDLAWTGAQDPDLCELVMHVSPERIGAGGSHFMFDAVAVVRERRNDPIKIHGIEIKSLIQPAYLSELVKMAPFFDFLWVAVPEQAALTECKSIPDFVGILRMIGDHVAVERQAVNSDLLGGRVLEMAKGLLLRSLKR